MNIPQRKSKIKYRKVLVYLLLLLVCILIGFMLIQGPPTVGERPDDFVAYWSAGRLIAMGDNPYSIKNIVVTGFFQGTMIIGYRDTLSSDDSIFDNFDDIFLAKYDPEGNYLWSLREGGGMLDGGERLQIYDNDKILLSGYYWIEATFSYGNINETTISNIEDTSSHFAAKNQNMVISHFYQQFSKI